MSYRAVDPGASRAHFAARAGWSRFVSAPRARAALLVAAAATLSSCMYGPVDDGATGAEVEALTANTRTAFDYFLAKGLTAVQSAGIVGNLMQESGVNPTAVQPGGPGRGIAQWSAGGRWDRDRGDNMVAFAASHGGSPWSLGQQLDFIWYELTHFSGYGLAALRASTTLSAATIAFEGRFEGCGLCAEARRITYAGQVLSAYAADAVTAWGGRYVSQSFPLASAGALSIPAGGTARISITMRNAGTRAWDQHTCLATTEPRDRRSVFAGADWPAPDRPACVPAGTTVAPGATHTFAWTMHAPAATGRYDEHVGMVEDGVTWFSATGEGGPPDNQIEGIFTVTPAPPSAPSRADAGDDAETATVSDAAVATDDAAVAADDAAVAEGDAAVSADDGAVSAGDAATPADAHDAGAHADVARDHTGDGGSAYDAPVSCTCAVPGRSGRAGSVVGVLVVAAMALARARRRRAG